MPSPAMSSPPALDSTFGATVVGIVISLCLFGAMCVQAFTYYQAEFKNDPYFVKILVAWSCVAETVHTAFLCVYLYEASVKHFGDYTFLPTVHWALSYSIAVATLISAPVQIFFAFRVYKLSKRLLYPTISTLASFIRVGLALTCTILAERSRFLSVVTEKYLGPAASALAIGAAVDIGNTVALCYYLAKSKNEITRSRKVIDTLIVWTIETGLITSISMTSAVLMLGIMQNNTIWLCPLMFSPKLYSNSLFASLNGRISLRTASSGSSHMSIISPNFPEVHVTRETQIRFGIPKRSVDDLSTTALHSTGSSFNKYEASTEENAVIQVV